MIDGHDTHHDPNRREGGNDRDERLLAFGEQIPDGDVKLERDVH